MAALPETTGLEAAALFSAKPRGCLPCEEGALGSTQQRCSPGRGPAAWTLRGALLLPRRVGPEGSRVTAGRKEADGDRGTFRKGSEYLPGPVRSDVNTSGFPGHTLFLEAAPWTEVPGGRGTETGRHRGPQRARAGRRRSRDKEEERGGESGEETGLNTGKDVASVPVTRETCDKDNGVKEEISHDTGTPGNLPSRDQTRGDTGQSWGFTVHTHSQRLTHRHTVTHRDTLTDMQRETHRYTHRHSHTHRDTLIDTQTLTHRDTLTVIYSHTEKHTHAEIHTHTQRYIHGNTDKHTHRRTHTETCSHTDTQRYTHRENTLTHRYTDTLIEIHSQIHRGRHSDIYTHTPSHKDNHRDRHTLIDIYTPSHRDTHSAILRDRGTHAFPHTGSHADVQARTCTHTQTRAQAPQGRE